MPSIWCLTQLFPTLLASCCPRPSPAMCQSLSLNMGGVPRRPWVTVPFSREGHIGTCLAAGAPVGTVQTQLPALLPRSTSPQGRDIM